jgi:hypothetical protein
MRELVPLAGIKRKARFRKPGYVEAYLTLGELDEKTQMVRISPENWLKIREQYRLPPAARQSPIANRKSAVPGADLRRPRLGLGDAIAAIATPIARVLQMDCIDPATGQLKPESGCQHRKDTLNKIYL